MDDERIHGMVDKCSSICNGYVPTIHFARSIWATKGIQLRCPNYFFSITILFHNPVFHGLVGLLNSLNPANLIGLEHFKATFDVVQNSVIEIESCKVVSKSENSFIQWVSELNFLEGGL